MSSNPLSSQGSQRQGTPSGQALRFTPVDPLRLLRQHLLLLGVVFVFSIATGTGIWFLLSRLAPGYTSEAQLLVTGGITDPYQGVQDAGGLSRTRMDLLEAFMLNQTIRIRSNEVLSNALKRPEVRRTNWFQSFASAEGENVSTRDARDALQRKLRAQQIAGSTLIQVSLRGGYASDLPVILDALIDVYLNKIALESGRESDNVRLMFVRERDRAEEELQRVREQLKQFTIQHDLGNLESKGNEATIGYRLLSTQMIQLQVLLEEARAMYQNLLAAQSSGQVIQSPDALAAAELDPAVSVRNERLRSLRETRDVLMARFGEHHRSVRNIELQTIATEQERNREMDRLLRERQAVKIEQTRRAAEVYQSQIVGLQGKLNEARDRTRDLNDKMLEYEQITSRAEAASERRARAQELLDSVRIQTDRPDSARVRKVFSATESTRTFPKPVLIIPGVTLILTGSAIGLLFLRESTDQRVKSPADLRQLPHVDVLGVLPNATHDPTGPTSGELEIGILTGERGLMAESFRQMRAAFLSRMEHRGFTTLMIVGAQAGSGASSITRSVAQGYAAHGRRVLIVDANTYRPEQHRFFALPKDPGLADVLRGSIASPEQVIAKTNVPGLDLLPVGLDAHSSPELLEGQSIRALLDRIKGRYDIILIDAPPALLTSECTLLAKQVDAVAVVVRAMADTRGMIGRMLQQLGGQGAVLLGVILNGVRPSSGGYFNDLYTKIVKYQHNGSMNGNHVAERSRQTTGDRVTSKTAESETAGRR